MELIFETEQDIVKSGKSKIITYKILRKGIIKGILILTDEYSQLNNIKEITIK